MIDLSKINSVDLVNIKKKLYHKYLPGNNRHFVYIFDVLYDLMFILPIRSVFPLCSLLSKAQYHSFKLKKFCFADFKLYTSVVEYRKRWIDITVHCRENNNGKL